MNAYAEAISRFSRDYRKALKSPAKEPTSMALGTSGPSGHPSVRIVLLKGFSEKGFVFFTNFKSRKARQLLSNGKAALCFYWSELGQQVNVEGPVSVVSNQEADAYWITRPRDSQIGAWASLQSQKLKSRAELLKRVQHFRKQFKGQAVPRPPHWSGFRLNPKRIEFWKAKPYRLHERTLYENKRGRWEKSLLYP